MYLRALPLEILNVLAPFASFETVLISSSFQIKEGENGRRSAGDEEKQNPFCSLERHGYATSNKHETALF